MEIFGNLTHLNYNVNSKDDKSVAEASSTFHISQNANPMSTSQVSQNIISKSSSSSQDVNEPLHVYPIIGNYDYWIKIYQLDFEWGIEIENLANISLVCNNTFLDEYINQISLTNIHTHFLHPGTTYKVQMKSCNELGCSPLYKIVKIASTNPSKPSAGPFNVSMRQHISFGMEANWSEIDEFHQNGEITLYNVILVNYRSGKNQTKDVIERQVVFDYVGKYEYVCISIAGKNQHPETGVYSDEVCAYSNESGNIY